MKGKMVVVIKNALFLDRKQEGTECQLAFVVFNLLLSSALTEF
jgi:hypothetical protein